MSLKKISPSCWLRMKSGAKAGFAVFMIITAIVGVVIGAVNATGVVVSRQIVFIAGAVCIISGLVASFIKGRMKFLPDSFIDEMNVDGKYTCEYCSADKLREACKMTKPFYGHQYVDPEIAEQWRIKNPKAFVQIVSSSGILCACFGVLAPKESFMNQFIDGLIADTQLRADNIYDFENSKKCTRLYISGVIIREPSTYKGGKRAKVMIWTILYYLRKLYGLQRKRTYYALAITEESERLMNNLGFRLASDAKSRTDRCNMYKYELTKNSWHQLIRKVGNYSPMCVCRL